MSQKNARSIRKKVRRSARSQLEALTGLPLPARLRLAWRLVRGRRRP